MYRQAGEQIMAAWRDVQRDMAAVEFDTPEHMRLFREGRRLREEYQRLVDAARTNVRPEPPPFLG